MSALDIRPAMGVDLDALVALGMAMRAESAVAFPAVDPEAVAAHLALVAANPDRLYAAIARRRGEPAGFVHGAVGPYAFSPALRGCCEHLYVVPDRRGGPAAAALLRAFLAWARGEGVRAVYFGTSTGVAPERTARLLDKFGFAPLGATYRKEID